MKGNNQHHENPSPQITSHESIALIKSDSSTHLSLKGTRLLEFLEVCSGACMSQRKYKFA